VRKHPRASAHADAITWWRKKGDEFRVAMQQRNRLDRCAISVAQGDQPWAPTPLFRARTDAQTKAEAAAVLKAIGLTVSDAFRLTMVRIAKEKALPFEPLAPNEETIGAMRAAHRGELVTIGPPGNLLASLDAGC